MGIRKIRGKKALTPLGKFTGLEEYILPSVLSV